MNKRNPYLRTIIVFIIVFMLFSIGQQVFTSFKTKYDLVNAKQENSKLKKEAQNLDNEIIKLKDKNYIQTYVSGTIFSTEKGTSIYVLPEEDKTPE
ncbi:MAG: septum formation initiator family protein [Bacilli bacterium]|jgi:cell division protein FtsB|nr:septum formation initiator family protein [Bacilli bacterium]